MVTDLGSSVGTVLSSEIEISYRIGEETEAQSPDARAFWDWLDGCSGRFFPQGS